MDDPVDALVEFSSTLYNWRYRSHAVAEKEGGDTDDPKGQSRGHAGSKVSQCRVQRVLSGF